MDRDVLRMVLESEDDVRANGGLFGLAEEYLEISLNALHFCAALQNAAESARDERSSRNLKNMADLGAFRSFGSPFGERIAAEFRSVYLRHAEMQCKLSSQKKKLERKLRLGKGWRNVSSAAEAARSVPLEAIGRWFESRGAAYEQKVRARRELVRDMYLAAFLTLKDLDTVRVLVDRLEGERDRTVRSIEFGERHPSTVGLVIEQIRRQHTEFMAGLEEFQKHVDICSKAICRARALVLQRITDHPLPS